MHAEQGGTRKSREEGKPAGGLGLGCTGSLLRRPPRAQDHTPFGAARGGRSERRGSARRLHGTCGADPFLRSCAPRDRPSVERRESPSLFKIFFKKQNTVKTQDVFPPSPCSRRQGRGVSGLGWTRGLSSASRAPQIRRGRLFAPSRAAVAALAARPRGESARRVAPGRAPALKLLEGGTGRRRAPTEASSGSRRACNPRKPQSERRAATRGWLPRGPRPGARPPRSRPTNLSLLPLLRPHPSSARPFPPGTKAGVAAWAPVGTPRTCPSSTRSSCASLGGDRASPRSLYSPPQRVASEGLRRVRWAPPASCARAAAGRTPFARLTAAPAGGRGSQAASLPLPPARTTSGPCC